MPAEELLHDSLSPESFSAATSTVKDRCHAENRKLEGSRRDSGSLDRLRCIACKEIENVLGTRKGDLHDWYRHRLPP